jgi:hypothetical protein
MALHRTVDLLPEIFRTGTNRKFLAATLDQLTQEPNVNRTQGYVGRRVGPGVNPADKYLTEPTATRTDYQLEPGVVLLDPNTSRARDVMTYPGIIDALNLQNGDVSRQDRLFESEYYSWDPFCDLDKFNNYSQYYWLPAGPISVDVGSSDVLLTDDFAVTRTNTAYQFFGVSGDNPVITLARGGSYTFDVNQIGYNFWIQAAPGVNGRLPQTPNISSRDVYGVTNNGDDVGTITFDVPLKNAQDFYYALNTRAPVDLVAPELKFNQLNNIYVSAFLAANPTGVDGITELDGRTIIFTNQIADPTEGGWQVTTQFDPENPGNTGALGTYDSILFDQTTDITLQSQRYSIWQINYVYDNDGQPFMQLSSIADVPVLTKFRIDYGTEYSSTVWYKADTGYFEQQPLLTAIQDTLYYQDSVNPEIFGQIRLIDADASAPIDINEIIGAKNYTSPNGVVFTNGLKVQFRGVTHPAEYQDLEYYVEGVGTGPGLSARVGFVDGQAYFGPWHVYNGQRITGLASSTDFQQYIYDSVDESIANSGAGAPEGAPLPTASVPGAALGNGIRLVPVADMITPETYTQSELVPYASLPYDIGGYDANLNSPLIPDYLVQNRSSQSRNAWSRCNRWFHIDVINYSAARNNQPSVVNNDQRAKRPIIEFRANLDLWNTGTQAKTPVNIIDFQQTDALGNVNGQTGYGVDGYNFLNGSRVIFAADVDPSVRNKIYTVRFIDPTNSGVLIIDLVPAADGDPLYDQTVVSLNGLNQQGKSFWFNGVTWQLAQQKTKVNQAPLFDVYDLNGFSFGDRTVYPSTTFTGSRLFGYTDGGQSVVDVVLGFPLKFLNINNVGDILFSNYLYTDTFIYVRDKISTTQLISTGFVRQYIDRTSFSSQLGWQPAAAKNRSRQVFRFTYAATPLILDVPVDTTSIYPPVQVFADGVFVDVNKYTTTVSDTSTTITFNVDIPVNTVIELQVISNYASKIGFYQVPLNLENNAPNGNSPQFTLGTIRTHYDSIGQNLRNLVGVINGANNSRDLGDIIPYGTTIVQHSSPLILPGVYLRDPQYELFNSLTFSNQEYSKYKARLTDLAGKGDFVNSTPTEILDSVLTEMALGKTEMFPFYWSDMIPGGETYTELNYTYSQISTDVFGINKVYDFTQSNFQSVLVYLNGTILTRGYDYTVSTNSATITISAPLAIGDLITIREYDTTFGSFIPNTPTKMGLYPAFRPEIYLDETYVEPTLVIRGHDGSITIAFEDYRDNVLLEFETRIFNNLKIVTPVPLDAVEVIPGQFRTTDYSLTEINSILLPDFLSWVGWNKLDYTTQSYLPDNPFTYNYSQSGNRLTAQPLLGAWRGIYEYFYDTITPNTTPWEMLGFSQEPYWWEDAYGPAPYTSGNLVLWRDLERGYIADPVSPRIDPRYARPGLTTVIPSGTEGTLLNPLQATVGNYDATSFRRSWTFGDDGPVENAWRTSSAWPFAVMRLLALTKPAEFFSLFADRDRYVYNTGIEQYLWDNRYRLEAGNLTPLYGNGVSKASYNNWIIDYNQQRGVDSSSLLTRTLANVDVRLCWRTAAFTDKNYLKIYSERSTPSGTNNSLLLPDESYQVLLYQNQPFEQVTYSGVIVQRTDTGWAVYGYNSLASYFEIAVSKPTGKFVVVSAGGSQARVSIEYADTVAQIPYGFVFTSQAAVCDFLYSYGKLLSDRGMTFEGIENGYIMDWPQMAQEFLYWSNQGWTSGSIINLNPAATSISVLRPGAVVESIQPPRLDSIVLNQNRTAIPPSELIIDRFENTFKISTTSSSFINFLNLRFTAYEHMVVLDNRSIFADLIYDPITGARQSRVLVSGWLSGDWNGTVNAPGFVLNQDNIQEWQPNLKYTKGDIVLFKDQYWSASTIIRPSAEFDFSLWVKSDYGQIQKGLLPNAANVSDQLAQSYSVYDANLETEVDIFSYGLIGFRPRQYMQALNLDDISQVNLYQQFLGTKGTVRSTNLFSLANLGKEIAEYSVYEYWAMLRSTYGANANRSFVELLLNEAKLTSDPSLIQLVNPQQISQADQTVLLKDIWKSSYKITSTDILPTTNTTVTDVGLPTAGYVSLDDVDITTFDLVDLTAVIEQYYSIGVGTTIWVARVNTYDWGVYRVVQVPGQILRIEDNLDNASLVTFAKAHGLAVDDILIIKNFSSTVNGVYRVKAVTGIYNVVIDYVFESFDKFQIGNGLGLTLETNRVAQPSDIPQLSYADELRPGVKVWVDNNGDGNWTVLEKTEPFVPENTLTATTPVVYSQFGASVSQGLENLDALIGAPGYNPDDQAIAPGAVYTFVRTDQDQYAQNSILLLNATDATGYGNEIDVGDQNWAVIGASTSNTNRGYVTTIFVAPGSNVFEQRQLLVAPDGDEAVQGLFGSSVTMSQNERWMYVGAPDDNAVYAFTRVDVQSQSVTYIGDGITTSFNWSNSLVIDPDYPDQLAVVLNNVLLTNSTDYTVTASTVELNSTPTVGQKIVITRRQLTQLDQQIYTGVAPSSTSGAGLGAEFTVNRVRGVYTVTLESPGVDYADNDTITINASVIGGGVSPANDITITVQSADGLTGAIDTISYAGSGVSNTSVFALNQTLATATSLHAFTVRVGDTLYRPTIDYTFDPVTTQLTFITVPGPGTTILVNSSSHFDFVEKLSVPGIDADAQFGKSVSSTTTGSQIMIGSPDADANEEGLVYVFDRSLEKFTVTDSTQTEYTTLENMLTPGFVAVSVNGVYLLQDGLNIGGTYSVDTGTNTVTISAPLAVGDVVQIETNQFSLLQTIQSSNPSVAARFGLRIDQCVNDCSLYIASPYDSAILSQAGKVEVYRNQARIYGKISTTIANPVLTEDDYIRINDYFVQCTGTTIADLILDINTAGIPNVIAIPTEDLLLQGDGTTRVFDVGTIYTDATSYTTVVYIQDVLQTYGTDYTYDNSTQQITFTIPPYNTSNITVMSGRMMLSVKNIQASRQFNRMSVLPGSGTLFDDLGLSVYSWAQEIVSPVPQTQALFGLGLFISDDTQTLMVGAPNGSTIAPTTFDAGKTYFDSYSTPFADPIQQSGAVYEYDLLNAVDASESNPAKFVFGQQFVNNSLQPLDNFGAAIDYTTGVMLIGAPGSDLGDSSLANFGQVLQYHNLDLTPAWVPIRVQQPVVDVNLLNTIFMYDRVSNSPQEYFDFFDPLQGRLLGVVRQNIDFIGAVDPATYNVGSVNNFGQQWGQSRVGQIWWNTSNVRFIDPHQNDIVYASRRWGQVFPGSNVEMYQWIVSPLSPADYIGPGTPYNTTSYVVTTSVNLQGFIETEYYFWVTGIAETATVAGKTLSIDTLTNYIENPRSSGISYLAPIDASTLAIYNGTQYISAQDTVLYVEYDQQATDAAVHVEYQLIAQDRPDAFLDASLYRKFLDSMTGSDLAGNAVPDPLLNPSDRYGIQYRPRQSMFVNRFLALKNYIQQANSVLALYPITEIRSFNLLNSAEPEPSATSGAWDKRVANIEELGYQDLREVAIGYRYLVVSDSTNSGFWTIYQVVAGKLPGERNLSLTRVQNYDTKLYWSRIDWFKANYNPLTRVILEVPNVSALDTITVPTGSAVKVTANAQNLWEIYVYTGTAWERVALQRGTIAISPTLWDYNLGRFGFDSEVFDAQYYDEAPITETRKILEAINQELFIGELLIERNRLLMLMFNYILSEQQAPNWLTKTSLIDVDHTIRNLVPYQVYRRDNQDFVLDYINEVKPYHVQVREFNLKYQGFDQYLGSVTDFDLPAYWDAAEQLFISPVLDNTGNLSTTSSRPSTDPVWTTFPWNQWYQNYLLSIESVGIVSGGTGYITQPTVTVTGDCITPATMTAQINSAGQVVAINIVSAGEGYSTTAIITITGGGGTGASAVAYMGNTRVRSLTTTIRYDRYQYAPTVVPWQSNVVYTTGAMVRYADRVWEANAQVQTTTFDPTDWTVVPAGDLTGVDRTMGYYVPTPDQPGLDLALLISGIDYPGVQVMGPGFDQNTGFDVGNFDINPFDNISYDAEGVPTYDPAILDAAYSSSFLDPYLGTLPTDINVDGGAFVDTYESHAPEELVPGITYDTLDMRVYTTPGADWVGDGHGWPEKDRNYIFDGSDLSFAGLLNNAIALTVYNVTSGVELALGTDYTVDWVNSTVTIISTNAGLGDVLTVAAYSLGGGNQLFTQTYLGSAIGSAVSIPMTYSLINSLVVFVNGVQVSNFTSSADSTTNTLITFSSAFTSSDSVTITALGAEIGGTWSLPVTQYIYSNGALTYTLNNSMMGTNPVNVVVNKNGMRARPAEGVDYIGDGSTVYYYLPTTGGYSLNLVADNDVAVYVDNVAQVLGVDFTVDPADDSTQRAIEFATPPADLSRILISVRTKAQYWIVGNQITFQPSQGLIPVVGDVISVTSWNDTEQQQLLTQVFVGPNQSGIVITEGYSDTLYDTGNTTNAPGSYDYQNGTLIQNNQFDTGRLILSPERLIVTLDGYYLFFGNDFVVDGSLVILNNPVINAAQVVVITSMTNQVVPDAMAFRIFQDMRGVQRTYRITPSTTTQVAVALTANDDVIYVTDVAALPEPNLPLGIFGYITIDGERITYRDRDVVNNTVSGLRRGTAGTAAAPHAVGAMVYDIGSGNLLTSEYQNYIVNENFLGDGTTTVFATESISVSDLDSTEIVEAVEVRIGGILQTSGYSIIDSNPVTVEFDQAPESGYQVSVSVLRGKSWYQVGVSTASDGVPLQDTNTYAARFLRGE